MPRQALMKYAMYKVAKQAGTWLSILITEGSFARFISEKFLLMEALSQRRCLPVMMTEMAGRLKSHLRTLAYSNGPEYGFLYRWRHRSGPL